MDRRSVSLVAATAMLTAGCGFMPNYSTGFRTGEIQKASYKGIFFKSYEGQIVLTGIKFKDPQVGYSNVFEFSATDPTIIKELDRLAGRKVTLYYNQWAWAPITQETAYTVYKIEEIK